MLRINRTALQQYSVAILSVGAALLLKLFFAFLIGIRTPFLLFFGATMISALYGGMRTGILATLLAAFVANFFFLEPTYALSLQAVDLIQIVVFILEGILISSIVATMQRAKRRAETATRQSLS